MKGAPKQRASRFAARGSRFAILAVVLAPFVLYAAGRAFLDPLWFTTIVATIALAFRPVTQTVWVVFHVFSCAVTIAVATILVDAIAFVPKWTRELLSRVLAALVMGVFLMYWGGLVYEQLLRAGPMSVWIERAFKSTTVFLFGSTITCAVLRVRVPPGRMARDLLRLAIAALAGMATLLLLWSWCLGQHELTDWLHRHVPWVLPLFGLSVCVGFNCVGLLKRISPRRARWRAYRAHAPIRTCPECERRMKVRFRDAVCHRCRVLVPIPAEWWICECGAPLRGVKGDRCTECGQDFEFDRAMERWMFASGDTPVGASRSSGLLTDSMDKPIDRAPPSNPREPT